MDIQPGTAAPQEARTPRLSQAGQRHFVTVLTLDRATLFAEPEIATAVARATLDLRMWGRSRAWCWVLMPDRWLALVEVGAGDTLAALMQRVKANMARAANRARGGGDRVWQAGFDDHPLQREDELLATARYLIASPKRAGLAERIADYPYWNAAWL